MRIIWVFLALAWPVWASGQVRVAGQVVDLERDSALAGATILDVAGGQGTVSGEDGNFDLLAYGDTLEVSYVGYRTARITGLRAGAYYTVGLSPDTELKVVVVSAEAPRVNLQIAEAVQTLSKEDLFRLQSLNPQAALNQIPGVYMHSGALNTNRITIRGIGARTPFGTAKIRAYFNEIPLTNGVGETVIEDFDLSLFDQIQVWKGPTASSYGAALGGVIQLQTDPETLDSGSTLSANYETGAYELDRLVLQSRYRDPDEGLSIRLNYNRTEQEGYRENNQYNRESFTALGTFDGSERHQSSVIFNYTDVKAFIPSSLNEEDYRNNPERAAFTWAQVRGFEDYQRLLAGLSHRYDWWRGPQGQALSTQLSVFTQFRDNYESRPFNILRENNWSGGLRMTMDYRKRRNRRQPQAQVGLEWFNERYAWTTNVTDLGELGALLSDNRENRRYLNLFASLDWDLTERWFTKLGLNYNQTRYRLTDYFTTDDQDTSGDYGFDPLWSPRLSLGYRFTPRTQIFATASHGFSVPTLEETLNPDGSRNPDIQAERGWNFELGLRGGYIDGRLHYDLALYRMEIKDLLVARRTGLDQFQGINAGRTAHNGLEARIAYDWLRGTHRLSTNVAYQYADYRFDRFVDGDDDYSGNALTGVAPHQLNATLDLNLSWGLYAGFAYEYLDALPMRDDSSVFSEAYQLLNGKLGWRGEVIAGLSIDAYVGVNNLCDEKYASMILINAASFGGRAPRYYYPGLPRHTYGGVRLEYRWMAAQ